MTARLRAIWLRLLDTLWFVPAALVLAGIVLAVALVELSAVVDRELLVKLPRVFGASADGSRALLGAVASSMITVAGLSFSLTMVAVTQASSQYTPRILRNFVRDRANQVVLGVFVAIFAYCLVVLRTIRGGREDGVDEFVPSIAVLAGVLAAIAGVGVLVFFVHHIATTLQASNILARVARETVGAIDRLFPDELGEEEPPTAGAAADDAVPATAWSPVPAAATGYIQAVDSDALLRLAGRRDCIVRMERGVGEFVVEGTPIAAIAPQRAARGGEQAQRPDGGLSRTVAARFVIAEYRTVEQDAAFGVRQLVDVALKALSPGVNDTTTAVSCVDYLGAVLVRAAGRRIESPARGDDGEVLVIARGPTFASLLAESVDEIRQHARGNVSVLARLLEALAWVAGAAGTPGRRRLVAEQVALVAAAAERSVESEHDRGRLRRLADHANATTVGTTGRPVRRPPPV